MQHASNDTEWNPTRLETIRRLWAEGHSTAEIGRRMGISKNAVVGKAHRMHLPARPSPIRRGERRPRDRRPRNTVRSVPLPSFARMPETPKPAQAPTPRPPVARVSRMWDGQTLQADRTVECCWPLGEPGKPGFRQCDDPTESGKPYCEEHCRIAYVKVRDRRMDAH